MRRSVRSWNRRVSVTCQCQCEERRGGTHDSCRRIHRPAERVDGDDMRRLLVPGPVFDPIGRRHLLPRVVELGALLEDLHRDGAAVCARRVSVGDAIYATGRLAGLV